jgi:hypothetical protein
MTIPVLVLPYPRSQDRDEDPCLEQRMDEDYIRAFAPAIGDLSHLHRFTNAYIVPIDMLYPDQIAFLQSRGAFEGHAKTIEGIIDEGYLSKWWVTSSDIWWAGFFNYVGLFREYRRGSFLYADAYVVKIEDWMIP